MASRTLNITAHNAPLRTAFNISRGAKTSAETVCLTIEQEGVKGRGECVPYARYGENAGSVIQQIAHVRGALEAGMERAQLQTQMPNGAARCAIDCALWDLEAKQTGRPVWHLAGLPEPRPQITAVSLSLDTPKAMAEAATATKGQLLKLKLGEDGPLARLDAVHRARPDAQLILDANEGLSFQALKALSDAARTRGVVLIEQPLHADADAVLADWKSTVTLCADESAHTSSDIERLAGLYDAVNIKLDKTGGLTEAIAMAQQARAAGMGVMVGCMVAGSLSMAPALLLGGLADFADLDGPLWLASDIENGLAYQDGVVQPASPALWG